MFKRTNSALEWHTMSMGQCMVKHKWDNEYLVARSTYDKENKKRIRQSRGIVGGTYLNANKADDRKMFFMKSAPMTSRLLLKRGFPNHQANHWTQGENRWQIHKKNHEATHFETRMNGGLLFTRNWDNSIGFVDDESLHVLKREWMQTKNDAINVCEQWGLKTTVMDSELNSGPRIVDVRKRHHPLYADNFPYVGENVPYANRYHGDADYSWRGTDKYDYSVYGAKTVSPYNYFRPSRFDAIRKLPFFNKPAAAAAPMPASIPKKAKAEPKKEEAAKTDKAV